MRSHSMTCRLSQDGFTYYGSWEDAQKQYCTCGAAYPEIALSKLIKQLSDRVEKLEKQFTEKDK